jgi:hypothetical protein
MSWAEYKQACDQPDVVSRWLLEQTCELLDDDDENSETKDVLHSLHTVLQSGESLAKPADHKGGVATDMFRIELSASAIHRICDCVAVAAAAQRETRGTRGRGLGGFVEAWREYAAGTENQ